MGQPKLMRKITKFARSNLLLELILCGVILGATAGLILRSYDISSDAVALISYPGEVFMRSLKMMVLPFIMCCLIVAMAACPWNCMPAAPSAIVYKRMDYLLLLRAATLNISKNIRIAVRTIVYFVLTSVLNVVLGITIALVVHPGNPEIALADVKKVDLQQVTITDGFLDMGRNVLTDNIFQSTFQQTFTKYNIVNKTLSDGSVITTIQKKLLYRDGTNMIGLIFFCLLFGAVLGTLEKKKDPVIHFFATCYEVMQKILIGVIWTTPIGVASIICGKIISVPDLWLTIRQLSLFIASTVGGFLFYQLILLQLIYFAIIRKNPYKYYFGCIPAIATAFATASKAASLPIAFQTLEQKLKMSPKITSFVLPIGTINMDGSALYLSLALVFLTQLENMSLDVSNIVIIGLGCTAASMSSAAVPSAAIVLLIMLCSMINIPTENVGLLLAVDWFLDRFRTPNNLLGDCYTVAVVQHLSKDEIPKDTENEDGVGNGGVSNVAFENDHNTPRVKHISDV